MSISSKQLKKLLALTHLTREQWDSFNAAQRAALIASPTSTIITDEAFMALEEKFTDPDTGMSFKVLSKEEEKTFQLWARVNYKAGDDILNVWHPIVRAECKLISEEKPATSDQPAPPPAPTVADIGANTIGKRRGPSGPRTGDAIGAKPLVRKLLGTKDDRAETGTPVYPAMTMEEICTATKKSDVNIRTILSDLRSPKYCGAGGVFKTVAVKTDGKTYYQYQE